MDRLERTTLNPTKISQQDAALTSRTLDAERFAQSPMVGEKHAISDSAAPKRGVAESGCIDQFSDVAGSSLGVGMIGSGSG